MEQPPVKVIHAKSGTTSADIPTDQPVMEAVFVDDKCQPTGYQPEFVLEFDENIGDVANAAGTAPTAEEYNTLVAQFNALVAKMAEAGILQRPNGNQ